jgi:hypothetical protein
MFSVEDGLGDLEHSDTDLIQNMFSVEYGLGALGH